MNLSQQAQALHSFVEDNKYVCPWGGAWDRLWKLLPPEIDKDGRKIKPPPPLILTGWYITSNLEKSFRLQEHIAWADHHGVIDKIDHYLRKLPADKWHTWHNSKYHNGS